MNTQCWDMELTNCDNEREEHTTNDITNVENIENDISNNGVDNNGVENKNIEGDISENTANVSKDGTEEEDKTNVIDTTNEDIRGKYT